MANPPSQKQLDFLERLGYAGVGPLTMTEASVLIDSMVAVRDSAAADEMLRNYRASHTASRFRPKNQSALGGCLVMLFIVGGCGYFFSAGPDKRHAIQAPLRITQPVVPEVITPVVQEEMPPVQATVMEADPMETAPLESPVETINVPAPAVPILAPLRTPEQQAASQLNLARQYLKIDQFSKARKILTEIIEKHPGTESAQAAQRELDRLPKSNREMKPSR